MSVSKIPANLARLTHVAPVLLVKDIHLAVDFWCQRCGFQCTPEDIYGEPPGFAMPRRDSLTLMLALVTDSPNLPYWKIRDKLWNCYFWVDDARKLFEEFTARGAPIDYGLCEQPYDCLEFGIQDLENNDIGFGQVL
ncbi:MAG: VOC family protein [Opitutales bacterium]